MNKETNLRWHFWKLSKSMAVGTRMVLDKNWDHLANAEMQQISSILPNLKECRVLDLGAGIGRFTTFFAQHAKSVVAVDLIDKNIEDNRKRNKDYSNVEYICSDALNLKFEKGSFDLIFSSWLLMYLTDHEVLTLLDKCHDWLKVDGMIFFRESCDSNYCGSLSKYLKDFFINRVPHSFKTELMPGQKNALKNWMLLPIYLFIVFIRPRFYKKHQQVLSYRSEADYISFFLNRFNLTKNGYISAFKELYNTESQKYWLLESSTSSAQNSETEP
jgi:2-polyprenyl-3-methyl-5-hydroxy-6-metoxy-1,4-benzoquinol methylase